MKLFNKIYQWIRGDTLVDDLRSQIQLLSTQCQDLKQAQKVAENQAQQSRALFDNLNARIATISQSTEVNLRDESFGARFQQEAAIRAIKDQVVQQAIAEVPRMVYLTTKKNERTGADVVTAVIRFLCPNK